MNCEIEGCAKRKYSRGMCQMHYMRNYHYGNPLIVHRRVSRHGLAHKIPEYSVWQSMIRRCTHPNSISFRYYGGRGINVCDRWRHSFENFLTDMGCRPEGMSLDRIDGNGNYEPSNCRWATQLQQDENRRSTRRITVKGETRTLTQWSNLTGTPRSTIQARLRRGMSSEAAVLTPKAPYSLRKRNDGL